MSTTITRKQATKKVREHLKAAVGRINNSMTASLTRGDGDRFTFDLPAGIRVDVRATPKGDINVKIADAYYGDGIVDRVLNENMGEFNYEQYEGLMGAAVENIKAYERWAWGRELGKVEFEERVLTGVSASVTVVYHDVGIPSYYSASRISGMDGEYIELTPMEPWELYDRHVAYLAFFEHAADREGTEYAGDPKSTRQVDEWWRENAERLGLRVPDELVRAHPVPDGVEVRYRERRASRLTRN